MYDRLFQHIGLNAPLVAVSLAPCLLRLVRAPAPHHP